MEFFREAARRADYDLSPWEDNIANDFLRQKRGTMGWKDATPELEAEAMDALVAMMRILKTYTKAEQHAFFASALREAAEQN